MEAWIEHRIDIINTLHTKGFLVMSKVIFFLFMFTYSFLHANTQILIIHSYHESYPWSANQDKGFKQALDKEKELYPLYSTEYLDTKRRGIDKDYEEEVVHYMTAKYKGYQPKLIYTTDDDAFSFMLHNKERLFPSVPLVFSGVNDLSKRDMISGKTYSGIFEEKDISTNIKLIKTLFPQEKEIMLVGDNSTTASVIEKKFINKFKRSGLKIHSIHGKDYQSTLQQLKRFKGKIVTLTTVGGFKTINGHLVPLKQAIKEIKDVGDFIAIALEDTYIQQGVIGGFVNNGKVQGKEAGEVALDILKAPALKLPESILGVRNFMFDIKALDQLEIILPEEIAQKSQFINQPESFVHKYERVLLISIYGLIAVILFGSLYFTWYMYGSRKTILEKGESLAVITESMDKAQAIAHLGHWDWNIKNNSLWWSDEIYRIFGLEPQEFEATYEAFMSRVHPEDQEKVNEAVNYALKNESDYHIVHRIVQKDGTQRHVIEEGSLKLDGKGVPVRMIGVVNDITDEFEREQSILLQAEIFNAVQDSIMVHDLEGHFVYLNENAWKSRGYSEEEMLKMTVEELDASEYNNATPDEMKKFIQSIKDEGHVKFKVEHVCKSGKRLPVEIYSKLITLNEKPYILSSVRDITEQKKASDAIEASEKKYRDFVENSMVGIYHTRLSGEILYVNPALVKMLGCTSVDEIIGVNSLKMYNTAQDREKFIHELQKTGRLANYELIVQDINNNPFPIMLSAILEGETLTGMMIDMSELKKSQAEIEKLSKVVEQIDDSVAITDNMGVITYANQAFYDHTGYSKEDVLGKTPRILKSGQHNSDFYKDLWHTILKGEVFRTTLINKKKNGELFYEKKTISPLKDDLNNIIGYISSGKDTTMEAMMHKEIEYIASTDKLTGIHNRHKFEELFILELERSRRYGHPLSLILIDIDHFKAINDTYGHDIGDEVLKSLVNIIQIHLRKFDIFARWGGEEFLILAPETDLNNVKILAEKLRLAVEAFSFPKVQEIRISAGISQFKENDSFDDLFKRADKALYNAKENGRNQVSSVS